MQKPSTPRRKPIRLRDYDYSQPGAYYVTIVAYRRECLFAEINNQPVMAQGPLAPVNLTAFGRAVLFTWDDLVNHISGIELGPFVVMPYHIHGIVYIHEIDDRVGVGSVPAPKIGTKPPPEAARRIQVIGVDGGVGAGSVPAPTIGVDIAPDVTRPIRVSNSVDRISAITVPTPRIKPVTLSEIVRQFKTHSGRRINELRGTPGAPVWQRNYFERVIRNQKELQRITEYIMDNPRRWFEDPEYRENG